jgi:hypothetical protein
MITTPDLIAIICHVLDQATTSWTRTLQTAMLLFAAAMTPATLIILITLIR